MHIEIQNTCEAHAKRKSRTFLTSGISTIPNKLELLGLLFGHQLQIGIIPQVFVAVRHKQYTLRIQSLYCAPRRG